MRNLLRPRRPAPAARWPRTAARLVLALGALLASGTARALDLDGGPTVLAPGASCAVGSLDPGGTSMTVDCTITSPGRFVDLFFGIDNTGAANGMEMNGQLPSGGEIFRYRSSTERSITYTSTTTVDNLVLGETAQHVNSRLVLTLIDPGGTPANNAQGDVQKLFRISSPSFSVRVDVTSNSLTVPVFGPSNTAVFNASHAPPNSGSTTSVSLGLYYKLCSP